MKIPLALALVFGFFAVGCTPAEEEVHPKRRSARADNLQRYVHKTHQFRALALARSKPIVQEGGLSPEVLKELVPPAQDTRLSALVFAQKNALENAVREHFASQAADETASLLTQFRDEAVALVQAAPNPQQLAADLNAKTAEYSQKLAAFAEEQGASSWAVPAAEERFSSKQQLQSSVAENLQEIEQDYGPLCAQKAGPVLQKMVDEYALALSSGQEQDALQRELSRVGNDADKAFASVVAEYGDPVIALSEGQASALRARLIEMHQQVEKEFENLYGKEAVLRTRDIFEKYKSTADRLVRMPARLSRMQESLLHAGEKYRQEMTALQARLNEELEINAAKVRGTPLSLAKK